MSEIYDDQKITSIVITGRSTKEKDQALYVLQKELKDIGYTVYVLRDTLIDSIYDRYIDNNENGNCDDIASILNDRIKRENDFLKSLSDRSGKSIIIYDCAALDISACTGQNSLSKALSDLQLSEIKLRDDYDGVFLLRTDKRENDNVMMDINTEREQKYTGLLSFDEKIMAAWTGHTHFRMINEMTEDSTKRRLIKEVMSFLGEPEPFEIERKYIIRYPDISKLEKNPFCRKVRIVQTYLKNDKGENIRIRQRGINGEYIYFQTMKKTVSMIKKIEIEKRLTKDEYFTLLNSESENKRQIVKDRYCLCFKDHYFEIDVYPFWSDRAVMEIELCDENEKVSLPDMIDVIMEVTGDKRYSNFALARRI